MRGTRITLAVTFVISGPDRSATQAATLIDTLLKSAKDAAEEVAPLNVSISLIKTTQTENILLKPKP